MTEPQIRRATPEDARDVAALIGAAFHDLAVSTWLIPDGFARQPVLTANFQILVEHALDHGEIHLIDDTAAAVWFHLDHGPLPPPTDYDLRLELACGPFTERFRQLDDAFETHHPRNYPHHHLAFLATRPGHRDQGLGRALLDHHHTTLDRLRIPAYLEASSSRVRRLYQRHGYQPRGGPFHLPDGPPLWPMWREPV
jgi:GNAT superfamily N-acetyltransferase